MQEKLGCEHLGVIQPPVTWLDLSFSLRVNKPDEQIKECRVVGIGIDHGRLYVAMAQKLLERLDIVAAFLQMCHEQMTAPRHSWPFATQERGDDGGRRSISGKVLTG